MNSQPALMFICICGGAGGSCADTLRATTRSVNDRPAATARRRRETPYTATTPSTRHVHFATLRRAQRQWSIVRRLDAKREGKAIARRTVGRGPHRLCEGG